MHAQSRFRFMSVRRYGDAATLTKFALRCASAISNARSASQIGRFWPAVTMPGNRRNVETRVLDRRAAAAKRWRPGFHFLQSGGGAYERPATGFLRDLHARRQLTNCSTISHPASKSYSRAVQPSQSNSVHKFTGLRLP